MKFYSSAALAHDYQLAQVMSLACGCNEPIIADSRRLCWYCFLTANHLALHVTWRTVP